MCPKAPQEKSKVQEATAATISPPSQSKAGGEEAKSDGDNPHVDNEEEGNDDAKDSRDEDTKVEEFGDRESAVEKYGEQVEDSYPATTPEASMEMVHEFYENYYCTVEKKALSKNSIKKEPMLDSVQVRSIPVDISKRTITRVLMGGRYTWPT
ncbi:hypothetical protein HAX54_033376 [Datura stramonium]|uniref:Uncharacterized protein n=1 Tax=Datura stramonium TaxID=4076 RepID=A0ABS8VC72_DATST|nr:hypothetical protein [Datura stramonium]